MGYRTGNGLGRAILAHYHGTPRDARRRARNTQLAPRPPRAGCGYLGCRAGCSASVSLAFLALAFLALAFLALAFLALAFLALVFLAPFLGPHFPARFLGPPFPRPCPCHDPPRP